MQFQFPIFIRWINYETGIAIRPQVDRGSLLRVLSIQHLPFIIEFQNICENGVGLLNALGSFPYRER